MSKQSSVDFILNAFNLLSDSDFKAWMLNNYDKIKAMHNKEIVDAHVNGNKEYTIGGGYELIAEHYYNETFGNEEVL
jgi:hypothetical protein